MGKSTDLSAKVSRDARNNAIKKLIRLHKAEFDELRDQEVAVLKVMYGWTDGRKNRSNYERDPST